MHIIAGIHKNRTIHSPKSTLTRPTSSRLRETLFNICQGIIEGADFLDLFAGSGAMGLEALSRGAKSAVFVDSSKESIQCINKNLDAFKFEKSAKVLCSDVFIALKKLIKNSNSFDIIYMDPPYEKKAYHEGELTPYSQSLLLAIDTIPLLKEGGFLYIEDIAPSYSVHLQTLKLMSARRAGKATLFEFQKRIV